MIEVQTKDTDIRDVLCSVATHEPYFGQIDRLSRTVLQHSPWLRQALWTGLYPPHSPDQMEMPYAFKLAALDAALRPGTERVMWCDAVMVACRDVRPVLRRATELGAAVWTCGWSLGQWATDRALAHCGIDRDIAFAMPLAAGGCYAVDLATERGQAFMREMNALNEPAVLQGAWYRAQAKPGELPDDPRVLGHRHDQVALTIAAARTGIPIQAADLWIYWYGPREGVPEGDPWPPPPPVVLTAGGPAV